MPNVLTLPEINDAFGHLRDAFRSIREIKKRNSVANLIKYPQIPSVVTESLAVHIIKKNLVELKDYTLTFGGNVADIIARKGADVKKIEVKATGKSAFQRFGPKDIHAHYLIWIHFDTFFESENDIPLEVFVLKDPSQFFNSPRKIVLADFKLIAGDKLDRVTWTFDPVS